MTKISCPKKRLITTRVFRRGGRNHGDEDFAFFKCPGCSTVYQLEYEVDTVYLNGPDLSERAAVSSASFTCIGCRNIVPPG